MTKMMKDLRPPLVLLWLWLLLLVFSAMPSNAQSIPGCSGTYLREVIVDSVSKLNSALTAALPGDQILIQPGIYSGNFVITKSGTATAPIAICGTGTVILNGGSTSSGYALHVKASRLIIANLQVRNTKKGIILDSASNNRLSNLEIYDTGEEALHFRTHSANNILQDSKIHDTGLLNPEYGEGVYVGSAKSHWCTYTSCDIDKSNNNKILRNNIYNVRAENIDIKEGTTGTLIEGNEFDGSLLQNLNAADSWMDIKGNNVTIRNNRGKNLGTKMLDGYQTHQVVAGWSQNILFSGNTSDVHASGYAIRVDSNSSNVVVECSNTVVNAGSGLSNVPCVNSSTPTPTPTPTLTPAASQFGSLETYSVVAASSIADAVTKVRVASGGTRVRLPAGTFRDINITVQGAGSSKTQAVVLEGQANGSTILSGKVKIVVKGSNIVLRYLTFKDADSFDYGGGSALIKFDACLTCGLLRATISGGPAASMDAGGNDLRHFKSVMIGGTSQNVEIGYNTFRGKRNAGSMVLINRSTTKNIDGHRIYKNLFSDRQLMGNNANDFDVIRVGDSATSQSPSPSTAGSMLLATSPSIVGNIVEFNVFQNVSMEPSIVSACNASNGWNTNPCKGEPEIISVKAPQSIVRFNSFFSCSGGITVRHGFQSIIEGNYMSGKNVAQGVNVIKPNTYGIRIIGENHLVMNNHIQDLSVSSSLLAGISVLPGQSNAALSGYWPVYDSIIAMNTIKNVDTKVLSLASDYGNNSKTILPTKMVISNNVFIANKSAAIVNQATSTTYLSSIIFKDNYNDGVPPSGALSTSVNNTTTIATIDIGNGITAPSSVSYVAAGGILSQSSTRRSGLLSQLRTVSSDAAVQRMQGLMKFLKLSNGALYSNMPPLRENQVGISAP